MSKLVVHKKSSENKYLHLDFHISCDEGLCYLARRFGQDSVVEFMNFVASRYYSILSDKIRNEGLITMKEYLEDIYNVEEAPEALSAELCGETLHVIVRWCPAIKYMKQKGRTPSPWYIETTRTLYRAIAENAGYSFVLESYNDDTGAAEFKFFKS